MKYTIHAIQGTRMVLLAVKDTYSQARAIKERFKDIYKNISINPINEENQKEFLK